MSFDPLNPWGLFDEADARERERRHRLGKFGRLREDAPLIAIVFLYACTMIAVTAVPWLVGACTIGYWLLGE